MTVEKLRIGQKVTIFPMDQDEQYVSSVYDIDAKGIYMPIPFAANRPLVLTHGQKVQVKYMGEDSAYIFSTEAIGRKVEQDKLPMYIFRHPRESEIERVQMRQFVRVPVMIEVRYAPPPTNNETPAFKKAYSVDMSGGGMKIAVKEPINKGTMVLLCFTIHVKAKKKQQEFKLLAQAVRCQLVDEDTKVYHVGFKFMDIRAAQQDIIMAFVFERMAEIKRRQ